ncbi:endoglucanase 11-like [Chenopodium quinoa]|uniref:Endoglucanase n=1 Tax=Chenopodium quinoa TaxID=63459 RepID=A0A803LY13_CHEQI|nr:endoglucanase 11-like [Chenopodium quinoa]
MKTNSKNYNLVLILFIFAIIPFTFSEFTSKHYVDALSKSLLYFEAQRSGHLPHNQRVVWRHHSALLDGLEQEIDLVGGYYDAGDNVKFGFPMAFTVTMLSWGVLEYGKEMMEAGEYDHALEAIKWGTDYFIKTHPHPTVLWAQVGDGNSDHYCWQRPEDMTTSRQAYKVDESNPGSDVAGETAAAMAAASLVFRTTDPHYSNMLLDHAQQLFDFGDKYRGKYDDSLKEAKGYYPSWSGYKDELLWAALWLYKASKKENYLDYAINNAVSFGGVTWAINEFSWDLKYAGLQIIASMLLREEKNDKNRKILDQYKSKAEHYICGCLNKNKANNVKRTPGGLLYTRRWNNLQYVSNAAFLLIVYSDYLQTTSQTLNCSLGEVSPQEILAQAKSQVDYILGSNPMGLSYLVGFGPKYPLRVHHRGASIPSYKKLRDFIGCTEGYNRWYGHPNPNPNLLVGAVVGGPNDKDEFTDKRSNYIQIEACTYNTAPLIGVFARLHSIKNNTIYCSSI